MPSRSNFKLSSTGKGEFQTKLDLGGFGISRYTLDKLLFDKANELGVNILTQTICNGYQKIENYFEVKTSNGNFKSEIFIEIH